MEKSLRKSVFIKKKKDYILKRKIDNPMIILSYIYILMKGRTVSGRRYPRVSIPRTEIVIAIYRIGAGLIVVVVGAICVLSTV